jgi:hypothetical protein
MDGSDRRLFTEDHCDTGFYPGIFGISDKQTGDVGDEVIHEAETLPALPQGETMKPCIPGHRMHQLRPARQVGSRDALTLLQAGGWPVPGFGGKRLLQEQFAGSLP